MLSQKRPVVDLTENSQPAEKSTDMLITHCSAKKRRVISGDYDLKQHIGNSLEHSSVPLEEKNISIARKEEEDDNDGHAEDVEYSKANIDALVREGTGTGCGVVFRDRGGEILAAATHSMHDVLDPPMAEAVALHWAIDMALQLGFSSVHFETDCLHIVQAWYKNKRNLSYLQDVLKDCKDDIAHLDAFSISFAGRVCNKVAHFLASLAFSLHDHVWLDDFPPALMDLIYADVATSLP
ncbi:hypothetical protein RIF29_20915 [Crotalaria pallida]|uniref:RNase H type-1 domain-containing protein n=1 Tax=Crotalaria pallida TaxID=3830 RepID=A0AAN9F4C8_CROPI